MNICSFCDKFGIIRLPSDPNRRDPGPRSSFAPPEVLHGRSRLTKYCPLFTLHYEITIRLEFTRVISTAPETKLDFHLSPSPRQFSVYIRLAPIYERYTHDIRSLFPMF